MQVLGLQILDATGVRDLLGRAAEMDDNVAFVVLLVQLLLGLVLCLGCRAVLQGRCGGGRFGLCGSRTIDTLHVLTYAFGLTEQSLLFGLRLRRIWLSCGSCSGSGRGKDFRYLMIPFLFLPKTAFLSSAQLLVPLVIQFALIVAPAFQSLITLTSWALVFDCSATCLIVRCTQLTVCTRVGCIVKGGICVVVGLSGDARRRV